MQPQAIIGAGLAGLIAAYAWPNIPILEAANGPRANHKALLRFRDEGVSRLTGIPFRRVTVRKGIFFEGHFVEPTIALANLYSFKVLGRLASDRSIWNTEAVERFIAPESLYEQLIEYTVNRIEWGAKYDFGKQRSAIAGIPAPPVISTAALPLVIEQIIGKKPKEEFHREPVVVTRYRVPGADLFQTIYFPSAAFSIYRASMTGDLLIVESVTDLKDLDLAALNSAFGFRTYEDRLETTYQEFGKIIPLPDDVRKHLLFRLTHEHNVYSLGRFATWRNILLDDVVQDIDVIKRMLKSSSPYDARKA